MGTPAGQMGGRDVQDFQDLRGIFCCQRRIIAESLECVQVIKPYSVWDRDRKLAVKISADPASSRIYMAY